MKMSKILSLVLAIVMIVSCFAVLTSCGKKETITIWVSEVDGSVELAQTQVNKFLEANPDYDYEIKIEGVSEADAASKVLADVASAPDIYCFAQDQLARLVQAKALTKLGQRATAKIKDENDAGSVAAASVAGDAYAYPLTSDNGYYLYYNTSVVTDPTSLEAIIADCKAANLKFGFELENAWYTASFFFATGCHSTWTTDAAGEFVGIDDDFNSPAGLVAMQGMHKLTSEESVWVNTSGSFAGTAAIVTGIWNANTAEEYFGENFGATKLPSFTVDGTSYQLGSFSGNKLMGVKPQTDETRAVFCDALAQYLSGEECQMERYEAFQWGPSNKVAQSSDAVQANPSLAALAAQNAYATPQGNIGGSWWDLAKALGTASKNPVDQHQGALDNYDANIQQWLDLPPEVRRAFFVIGQVNGTNWDTDFDMTEDPAGTWTSAPLTFEAGAEFKIRQGHAWTVDYGADGVRGGANIKVETAGTYIVKAVIGDTVTIELIPVTE